MVLVYLDIKFKIIFCAFVNDSFVLLTIIKAVPSTSFVFTVFVTVEVHPMLFFSDNLAI